VDTARFIPQQTVDKRFGTFGFDESHKSPDPEIVRGGVHVLTAGELDALPTPLQTLFDATVSLIANLTPDTQAGRILAEITLCSQMTSTTNQTTIRDAVYECLSVHWMCHMITARPRSCIARVAASAKSGESLIASLVSSLLSSLTSVAQRLCAYLGSSQVRRIFLPVTIF
jgi:hypothetical protein